VREFRSQTEGSNPVPSSGVRTSLIAQRTRRRSMGASKPNRGLGLGSSRPSGSYGGICGSARWRRAAFVMSMLNSLGRPLCTAP